MTSMLPPTYVKSGWFGVTLNVTSNLGIARISRSSEVIVSSQR